MPADPASAHRTSERMPCSDSYRPEATVHGLFRECAARHPERVALTWLGGALR
jgi:non-ribosomal peptide synthetase component F